MVFFSQFLPFLLAFAFLETVSGNAELKALIEVKVALDPKGLFLSSWTEEGDPCNGSFEGVACNEHGKVTNISLQGKGLFGSLPPAISGLKSLTGLYLHYNSLNGEIPREISNLTELVDLYLNVNNLAGSIPAEIGNMGNLQGEDQRKFAAFWEFFFFFGCCWGFDFLCWGFGSFAALL